MRSYRSSKSDQSKRRVERIKVMTALKILRHHQKQDLQIEGRILAKV